MNHEMQKYPGQDWWRCSCGVFDTREEWNGTRIVCWNWREQVEAHIEEIMYPHISWRAA